MGHDTALKVCTLVAVQPFRNPIMYNKLFTQYFSYSLNFLIPCWVSTGISCKMIGHHKNAIVPINCRFQAKKI